jgi:hypothetical protein
MVHPFGIKGAVMKRSVFLFLRSSCLCCWIYSASLQVADAQVVARVVEATPPVLSASKAEKLRRLDIMLMVTGLRCRTTTDDFRTDFEAFEAAHMGELNAAVQDLRQEIMRRDGKGEVEHALDRLSVTMANQFGGGHPWLDCHQLKELAHGLAETKGEIVLREAADLVFSVAPVPAVIKAPEPKPELAIVDTPPVSTEIKPADIPENAARPEALASVTAKPEQSAPDLTKSEIVKVEAAKVTDPANAGPTPEAPKPSVQQPATGG